MSGDEQATNETEVEQWDYDELIIMLNQDDVRAYLADSANVISQVINANLTAVQDALSSVFGDSA